MSNARLTVWTLSYLTAGSVLPGILVWLPSAPPQSSLCEMLGSFVMVILLVDYLRNAEWADSPVLRANSKHRFSKSVGLCLLALWPLMAASLGRARDLHAVWGFPMASIYCSLLLGMRLRRIWSEPRPFRELPTYVYPAGRSNCA